MRSGRRDETDDQGPARRFQDRRRRHAGDERDVGGLDAAVGEIDRGRRLGGPADAHQHHVGLLEIVRQMPVVVHEREVHGVDALEILRVEHVLRARPGGRGRAEIGLQQGVHRLEHREVRRARRPADLLEAAAPGPAPRGCRARCPAPPRSPTARARAGSSSAPADRRARSPRCPRTGPPTARATVIRVSPVESDTRWRWK